MRNCIDSYTVLADGSVENRVNCGNGWNSVYIWPNWNSALANLLREGAWSKVSVRIHLPCFSQAILGRTEET